MRLKYTRNFSCQPYSKNGQIESQMPPLYKQVSTFWMWPAAQEFWLVLLGNESAQAAQLLDWILMRECWQWQPGNPLLLSGDKAKAMKREINTQWIYPPKANRTDAFKAAEWARLVDY